MSVTVGELARSPDQLCSLPERGVEPPATGLPVRDMTNISGRGGRPEPDDLGNKQLVLHCSPRVVRHQGDKESCHGNREKRHVSDGRGVVGEEQPSQQRLSGAHLLRQQWARHTQSKVHLSDPDDESVTVGGGGGGGQAKAREGEQRAPAASPADKPCPLLHRHPTSCSPETQTPPPSGRTRQLLKTHSVGSISSESLTISSLWDTPSYDTVPDFLSSLGFDDFDSPELIPDRFIPLELEFVRPSLMRQATLGSVTADGLLRDLSPPADCLLLGATADSVAEELYDNLVGQNTDPPLPPQTLALYLPSATPLPWQPASLETVAEETASELLSPRPSSRQSARLTPRLSSPLVSIDHTPTQDLQWGLEGDISAGLLGAGLRLRQQSLVREDLRGRQMSLGAESDTSSLYFSVSSHFEEGEKEVETGSGGREGGKETSGEETDTPSRRRRRGNYVPPPQLLMWLEKTESTEDTVDQPWPFSEVPAGDCSNTHQGLPDPPPPPAISLNGNFNNNCRNDTSAHSLVICSPHCSVSRSKDSSKRTLSTSIHPPP